MASTIRMGFILPAIMVCWALAICGAAAESASAAVHADLPAINWADCAQDDGYVAPVKPSLVHLEADPDKKARFAAQLTRIETWPPVRAKDAREQALAWLDVASLVDMSRGEFEGEVAYTAFQRLRAAVPADRLAAVAADIALDRVAFVAKGSVPEAGLDLGFSEAEVHARMRLYAKKLLGRLTGALPVHKEDR